MPSITLEKRRMYLCYSYLLNTTPWVIIRTGVGIPSLGFYYCPWFSLFPTLGYYSTLGFLFFPPWAIIQPLVFHFYPPLAKILSFSSLVYNISHPWFFTFFNPWLLFSPRFFLLPTLGYYPALGFFFFPPLAVIQP